MLSCTRWLRHDGWEVYVKTSLVLLESYHSWDQPIRLDNLARLKYTPLTEPVSLNLPSASWVKGSHSRFSLLLVSCNTISNAKLEQIITKAQIIAFIRFVCCLTESETDMSRAYVIPVFFYRCHVVNEVKDGALDSQFPLEILQCY